MKHLLETIHHAEKGQVLPLVLAFFVLGGLTVTPALAHTTTHLKTTRLIEDNVKATYAAEAGVGNVIWALKKGQALPVELSGGMNQMGVSLDSADMGSHTLYLGELIPTNSHANYLSVSGSIVWDDGAQKYKYTITVTLQGGSSKIHLASIGACLPDNYEYVEDSASEFEANLSDDEPSVFYDEDETQMVNWQFGTPLPSVSTGNPVKTQTFYIDGDGELEGDYTWVVANREDVGEVGEVTGTMYRVIATATSTVGGRACAVITANLLVIDSEVNIVDWKITN